MIFFYDFNANHYFPLINLPTRITDSTATSIDNYFINAMLPCNSAVVPVSISDHYPIVLSIPNYFSSNNELIKICFRNHSRTRVDAFYFHIQNICRTFNANNYNDVNVATSEFCDILFNSYNYFFPICTKFISKKRLSKPWMSTNLLNCIKQKHIIYKNMLSCICDRQYFINYRNILSKLIRTSKCNYFKSRFNNCINNSKQSWKLINDLIKPKTGKSAAIELIDNDGNLISDQTAIANNFNEFFSNVGPKLANDIPPSNNNPLSYISYNVHSFFCLPTNCIEVSNIINSFKNKGCDLQTIPNFIFKSVSKLIAPVLSQLINLSFTSGSFPDCLKIARVVPIFKKGIQTDCSNYRPISILSFISKVFEKTMLIRLTSFIDKYNIISHCQYGFCKGKRTTDAILRLTHNIYESLNNRTSQIAIFVDFSKAFDTLDHQILLNKLDRLGVRGLPHKWLNSYLSNRVQYVSVGGVRSGLLRMSTGVPQGSILGPTLFNLYINDMSYSTTKLSFIHYADDTTLFRQFSNISIIDDINSGLTEFDQWLICNKLSLNISKTFYMIFSNSISDFPNPPSIRGTSLSKADSVRFLGIMLDSKLNFSIHINNICNKISKSCGILNKLSFYVPPSNLSNIYSSLVLPYLIYGIKVWGGGNTTDLNRLRRLQDRCVVLLSSHSNLCIDLTFKLYNILPLNLIYKYFCLVTFYNYVILGRNTFFVSALVNLQIDHNHLTRFNVSNSFTLGNIRLSKYFKSFFYNSVMFWNALPLNIKNITHPFKFKSSIKTFLCAEL